MRTLFVMSFFSQLYPVTTIADAPHVTFLAHAGVPQEAELDEFLHGLEALVAQTAPFFLTTNELEFFGADRSIPVITLTDEEDAGQRLHEDLIHLASNTALVLGEPQYTMTGFRPHLSLPSKNERLPAGQKLLVDNLIVSEHRGELFADTHDIAVSSCNSCLFSSSLTSLARRG
jgi:hypothetical protein